MAINWTKIVKNYWTTVFIPSYLRFNYYKIFEPLKTFKFQGNNYEYFYHWYNITWSNERAVEIPIVCKFVKDSKASDILEIGNVLSHYFDIDHDIVDKYEKSVGVINEDVVDFKSSKKYDLIVSISTLEHVGWDETPRDPEKIFIALMNLKNCLAPSGKMIITLPIGQNIVLDSYLATGKVKFTENYYLRRVSKSNKWVETDSIEPKYDFHYSGTNLLFVGIYYKSE